MNESSEATSSAAEAPPATQAHESVPVSGNATSPDGTEEETKADPPRTTPGPSPRPSRRRKFAETRGRIHLADPIVLSSRPDAIKFFPTEMKGPGDTQYVILVPKSVEPFSSILSCKESVPAPKDLEEYCLDISDFWSGGKFQPGLTVRGASHLLSFLDHQRGRIEEMICLYFSYGAARYLQRARSLFYANIPDGIIPRSDPWELTGDRTRDFPPMAPFEAKTAGDMNIGLFDNNCNGALILAGALISTCAGIGMNNILRSFHRPDRFLPQEATTVDLGLSVGDSLRRVSYAALCTDAWGKKNYDLNKPRFQVRMPARATNDVTRKALDYVVDSMNQGVAVSAHRSQCSSRPVLIDTIDEIKTGLQAGQMAVDRLLRRIAATRQGENCTSPH